MTVLRSRTVAGQAMALANPGIQAALHGWEQRIAAARAEGHAAGIAEAQGRISAAEHRASQAEASARTAAQAELAKSTAALHRQCDDGLRAIAQQSTRLEELEKQLVVAARADLARLACAIAARVIAHEIDTDPGWMDELVAAALERIPDKRGVMIRLHPEDAAVVRERITDITADVPGLERVTVEADPGLRRGDLVLRSQGTRLDAGWRGNLDRLAIALTDAAPEPTREAGPTAADNNPGNGSENTADQALP